MTKARAMRANAFPGFVTDDVMYYHSSNRREKRKLLPGSEATYLLYNKKFSVHRSTRRLAAASSR
jgi:hypothetical protein